jgi:hypothetical protein
MWRSTGEKHMFVFLSAFALSIIGFFIHLFVSKEPKTPVYVLRLLLLYQLVFSVGLTSLLAFIGLNFMTEYVAAYSGWPACPFENLLGNVNLGYAVLGFMCIWKGDEFWLATIIGLSVWLLGDAVEHIIDMIVNHNYAPGNIGVPLYTDIIVPLILLILYAIYHFLKKRENSSSILIEPQNTE